MRLGDALYSFNNIFCLDLTQRQVDRLEFRGSRVLGVRILSNFQSNLGVHRRQQVAVVIRQRIKRIVERPSTLTGHSSKLSREELCSIWIVTVHRESLHLPKSMPHLGIISLFLAAVDEYSVPLFIRCLELQRLHSKTQRDGPPKWTAA
jgi:hypothetical protein